MATGGVGDPLGGPAAAPGRPWNHNLHYGERLLASVPVHATTALDVGCGEGILTRRLRERVDRVVGIDADARQIALARTGSPHDAGLSFVHGDVLTHRFDAPFDVVVSVATLHHLPTDEGLRRLATLVRPGGLLGVVGLARSTTPGDRAYDVLGAVATRALRRTGGRRYWEHSAPTVWPPPGSYTDIRRLAAEVVPGARYRRLAMWRYSLLWRRPEG